MLPTASPGTPTAAAKNASSRSAVPPTPPPWKKTTGLGCSPSAEPSSTLSAPAPVRLPTASPGAPTARSANPSPLKSTCSACWARDGPGALHPGDAEAIRVATIMATTKAARRISTTPLPPSGRRSGTECRLRARCTGGQGIRPVGPGPSQLTHSALPGDAQAGSVACRSPTGHASEEPQMAHDQELHDHDRGLSHDLPTLLSRRRALTLLGGAGLAAALAGCGITGTDDGAGGSTTATSAAGTASDGTEIPEETAGPYPGDGSNGVNVLTESGIVRSDITSSFGSASGVAQGVPLTVKLKVLDTGNGSAGLQGAAVYLWHCDRDGRYSLYSEGITQENYLRGVQETGSDGAVQFTSIYPA